MKPTQTKLDLAIESLEQSAAVSDYDFVAKSLTLLRQHRDEKQVTLSKKVFDDMVEYIASRTNCSGGWWNDSWAYDLIGKIEREVGREVIRHF